MIQMTNLENNGQETDELDEVNADEQSAAKTVDLRSLGIEPQKTPIPTLLDMYRNNVSIVKQFNEAVEKGTSDPDSVDAIVKNNVSKVLKRDGISEAMAERVNTVRDFAATLANEVFSTPVTDSLIESAVMLDELRNLVSVMTEEYQYHLNKAIQSEKDKRGIKHTPSETASQAKLTAIALNTLIKVRVEQDKIMPDLDDTWIATTPDNFWKSGGKRNGPNTDVFPRLPGLKGDGPMGAANNASHLVFRFQATGADEATVCVETTLNDVAHNVLSEGAYRVTGKEVADKLKQAKLGIGATDTEWSLEFKTGTLYGRKSNG